MGNQPSSRQDTFGTEGIGEEGDGDLGTRGHASQGGTAGTTTGGQQGNAPRPQGTRVNKQGPGETDKGGDA